MKDKCKVKNCTRLIRSQKHRLCSAHYQRLRLNGDLEIKIPVRTYKEVPIQQ